MGDRYAIDRRPGESWDPLVRLRSPLSRGSRLSPGRRFQWAGSFFAKIGSLLLAATTAFWAVSAQAAGAVVVASKIDTEGTLLGNMIAELIEARGIPVERRIQLGPTNIVRA